jgi:gas vesicle protein
MGVVVMNLSSDIIKQFVKMINDNDDNSKNETTTYGKVVEHQNELYVMLDGSEVLTPVDTSFELKKDDRVIVTIRDHHAVVIGNLTNPAIGFSNNDIVDNKFSELEQYIDDKIEDISSEITRTNEELKTELSTDLQDVNDNLKTSIRNTHTELEGRINDFSNKIESKRFIDTSSSNEIMDMESYTDNAIDIVKNTPIIKYRIRQNDKKLVGVSLKDAPSDIIYLYNGVDLFCMVSLLWAAVQQQQVIIEDLLNNSKEEEEGSE